MPIQRSKQEQVNLTLLHSDTPKLHTILAFLSAIGLTLCFGKDNRDYIVFRKRHRGLVRAGGYI